MGRGSAGYRIDGTVGRITAEKNILSHELNVLARREDRRIAARIALLEGFVELQTRRIIAPRIVKAPAGIDERYAVITGAVGIAALQREDVLRRVVLLLAPEVGERLGLVRRIDVERPLVGPGHVHHLVAHLDHDIVVLRVVHRGVKRRTGGIGPGRSLVRKTDLICRKLRIVRQDLAGRAEILDDLVVVLKHVRRTRRVDLGGRRLVRDDRNAAVGVVAVVGHHPQHRESAEEERRSQRLVLERPVEIHVGDEFDDVVGLGHVLVHHLPDARHVVAVRRGHAEFADFVHRRTVAADQNVVAGTLQPHVAAAADLLAPIGRDEMVEPVYGLHNVLLRLPGLVFTVGFPLEEIGTPRHGENADDQANAEYDFFHGP